MFDFLSQAGTNEGWLSTGARSSLLLLVGAAAVLVALLIRVRSVGRKNRRLQNALNHMTQGLCAWDAETRLVLCNDQYIEMYGMSPDFVKPGRLLREVMEHRKTRGNFAGDVDQFMAGIKVIVSGKANHRIFHLPDGRTIAVAERGIPGGGSVATHDDVTEQHNIEKQQAALHATEERRTKVEAAIAKFRERMENVVRTVHDSVATMKLTSSTLSTRRTRLPNAPRARSRSRSRRR